MMNVLAAVVAACGMSAVTFGLTDVASAAPPGESPLEQTVKTLEASGYHVVVGGSGEVLSCHDLETTTVYLDPDA